MQNKNCGGNLTDFVGKPSQIVHTVPKPGAVQDVGLCDPIVVNVAAPEGGGYTDEFGEAQLEKLLLITLQLTDITQHITYTNSYVSEVNNNLNALANLLTPMVAQLVGHKATLLKIEERLSNIEATYHQGWALIATVATPVLVIIRSDISSGTRTYNAIALRDGVAPYSLYFNSYGQSWGLGEIPPV